MKKFSISIFFVLFLFAASISPSVARRPLYPRPLGNLCRHNVIDALYRGVDISPRCCSAVETLFHVSNTLLLARDHWLQVTHRRCLDQAATPQLPPEPVVLPPSPSPAPPLLPRQQAQSSPVPAPAPSQ